MNASNRFARAFSLRDRARGSSKTRSAADFGGVFAVDESKKRITKDEERKVQEITTQLSRLGMKEPTEARILYALRARSAQGDTKEALRLLLLWEDSVAGVITQYDTSIKLVGAENREKVTCYLDSLLFALFFKTDVFEAVLFNTFEDEQKRNLVTILRLWVNLLRSGILITTDITQHLQAAIAECGWPDAGKVRQQDASEAFNFLMDKLQMPLLTLKTDIYHAGEKDASDDHKFITERMLEVAIPDNLPAGQVLTLESCLEEYFNNRVEVKRHLQRRNTVNSTTSIDPDEKSNAVQVEVAEVGSRTSSPAPSEHAPKSSITSNNSNRPLHMRHRATSIFSERKVEIPEKAETSDGIAATTSKQSTKAARKEVLMPAWQFLNLIPWYTDNAADADSQVRLHFSRKKLMLGICLKRYGMTSGGTPYRKNVHIDIPLELASPHFTTGDDLDNQGTSTRNFKLSLVSVVCHRGHSVEAGHYIAMVRAESGVRDRHDSFPDTSSNPPHDASHDLWLCFDDLASARVTRVADIAKALKKESPYLLFYRVQPINEDGNDENPPPYRESETSLDVVDKKLAHLSRPSADADSLDRSEIFQSGRESLEAPTPEEPQRSSVSSQRPSSQFLSKIDQLPNKPPSLVEEPKNTPSTISRQTSKSAQRAEGRPSTDSENNKFSASMSRLAARLSRDKLSTPEVVVDEVADEEVPSKPSNGKAEPASAASLPVGAASLAADNSRPRSKDAKRKKTFIPKSRRNSAGAAANGKPDRECIMM